MRFKSGQEITPNRRDFKCVLGDPDMPMPKFGKVYTVRDYPYLLDGRYKDYVTLQEMPMNCRYNEASFDPVISSDQLEDDLWEIQMLGQRLSDG